ncbi:GNAT family N-acetyltransferase [Tenggerimyces flavus]|uniref:GNAT family N-acetyltransferase n=1 Tax=Tenggerimyces flavus TaxID=1708749 RepID=A0ABV7YAN0_9ACTN|nr:GNAT family N-acetyltransferase [Tenggerimyces flavus]MBM7785553.1 ribosomal protein S18 acetylase RimI-like enzyme [Tenggerimyces flavus]
MRSIHTLDELRALTDDPYLLWSAQGFRPGVRAWTDDSVGAVAIAVDFAGKDLLVVDGALEDVVRLVAATTGDSALWPIGDADLLSRLHERLPGYDLRRVFGWMQTTLAPAPDPRAELATVTEEPAIDALLEAAFPTSLARPGKPGVARWWIVRGSDGLDGLDACGADAWSTEGVGFLAGVATSTAARGKGYGRAIAATAIATLVSDFGAAALMVDADNVPARKLYESLGMSYRPLRAMVPR